MDLTEVPFGYNTNAVSQRQFDEHIELYKGYINKTNEIAALLGTTKDYAGANAVYSKYRELKKEESFAMDGVILHEEYFKNMTAEKQTPGDKTLTVLRKSFDSFENWKAEFKACAMSARGWSILAYNQRTNSVSIFLQDSHDDGVIAMAYPLVVLDMYEHAYFMDYGTKKSVYIDKFFDSINWRVVETRAEKIVYKL
ncbi:MAG: superoxide dismutase [Clostridiales bacterium]|nr:superoxide dismutase [Clostridiales bacterium]